MTRSRVDESPLLVTDGGLAQPLPEKAGVTRKIIVTLCILAVVFCLSYLHLFGYFWERWTEEHGPFGYGYFVPPSVAYLLWCNRDQIRSAPVTRPAAWTWVLLGLAVLANIVAVLARFTLLQSVTFLSLIMLIPLCLWGPAKYKYLWAGLLYTATMIPWPGQIVNKILFSMQHLSIAMAIKMLGLFGLSPYADGVTIMLPHFSFDVAPACAGLTILFPTVACTILTAMMVDAALWRRLLLIALSVPVSILTNGGRILLIGLIGNGGGTQLANQLHDASGLVGVIICVLILSGIGALIGCGKYYDKYMPSWARVEEEGAKAEEVKEVTA